MDVLSEHGFRQDGRKPHESRRMSCRMGVYQQADGSAYLEQGLTKVLVAVYGPHEPRKGKAKREANAEKGVVNCQYSMATFSTGERKVRPRGDRKSMEFRQHLQKTFEAALLLSSYPNSQIDIYCEVLQADGGNLAACINCATLALVDAGIGMKGLVGASCVGVADKTPVVDLNNAEESMRNVPKLTIASIPRTSDILLIEMENRVHFDLLDSMLEAGMSAAKDINLVLESAIRNHVTDIAAAIASD